MSVAAEPKQPAATPPPKKPGDPVLGVTLYDRVFSFLTSLFFLILADQPEG